MAVLALIGNPNTGKTTLFNALTGLSHKVGNYPGVTVERKSGTFERNGFSVEVVDLPGTYSLSARSPDEVLAVNVLLGKQPGEKPIEGVIAVVDGSNIERNLYLISQLTELNLPLVIALTMTDIATKRGISVQAEKLSANLGVPVIPIRADRGEGIEDLIQRTRTELSNPDLLRRPRPTLLSKTTDLRSRSEVQARYDWVHQVMKDAVVHPTQNARTPSDRIDAVLTHRLFGSLILVFLLGAVFQAIYSWASPFMRAIESTFASIGAWISTLLAPGPLQSLLVDGVIGGVGSVVIFLPQILLLFLFLGILEDCGYMSRVAFLMDRLFKFAGLSGKSVIPLLSSFACAVPGIMATRTIENRQERFLTILAAPLMSCSARLPVYVLFIGAFVPNHTYLGGWVGLRGLVLLAMHLVGVVVAIPMIWILRRWRMGREQLPFLMELPSYKVPAWKSIASRVYMSGFSFLTRAGTVIVAMTIVIWALSYFPRSIETQSKYAALSAQATSETEKANVEREAAGEFLRNSVLGRIGHVIEPVVKPLGWDWKLGTATLAAFPAREVLIATLGTLYNLGGEEGETSEGLLGALKASFSLPVALSVMVFFALCCQCGATLATIRRETNSWRWPAFTFIYMTTLAYIASFATYQISVRMVG